MFTGLCASVLSIASFVLRRETTQGGRGPRLTSQTEFMLPTRMASVWTRFAVGERAQGVKAAAEGTLEA